MTLFIARTKMVSCVRSSRSARSFSACCARSRSVMSMMLPRTRTRSAARRRTNRTSQGISFSAASRCIHSNTTSAPSTAFCMFSTADSLEGRPSGCVGGLTATGPSSSKASFERPNRRTAFLFASTNRPVSTSRTTIASGAC